MKKGTALLTLAILVTPAWAVNKCPAPGGKFVYQDAPCEGAEKVNLSGAGAAKPDSQGSQYWRQEVNRQAIEKEEDEARLARSQAVNSAILNKRVIVGMTADEARRSWGAPTRINTSVGGYGRHEQWVYDRGNHRSQYIYMENGVVTSMQSPE